MSIKALSIYIAQSEVKYFNLFIMFLKWIYKYLLKIGTSNVHQSFSSTTYIDISLDTYRLLKFRLGVQISIHI